MPLAIPAFEFFVLKGQGDSHASTAGGIFVARAERY